MDLTLSEEQELIRSSARKLLDARCPISHVRAMQEDSRGYAPELWTEMAESGWMGIGVPEKYGGVGSGFFELCLIIGEQGRALLPSPFLPTTVLCGMPLAHFGTEEQKATHLPAIASGDRMMTCCGAGPGGLWSAGQVEVTATSDGRDFRLDGTVPFVPYGSAAEQLLVVSRRRGAESDELSVFLVDASTEGISCQPQETVALEPRYEVTLQAVPVSADRALGGVDRGLQVVQAIGEWGAAAACAAMVAGAERVLDMTVAHAVERRQFGRPIGSFQAIQHYCADMATAVLNSQFITLEAVWRLSEGLTASEEVSMAKAWVSDAYQRVCALGHQVHGAIGFTREHDLHLFTRHAYASALDYGDGDHHREQVAQQLGL